MGLSVGGIGSSLGYPSIQYGFSYSGNPASVTGTEQSGKILSDDEKEKQTGIDDPIAKAAKKEECQTCKNRKYVDGSDEMVSFKSPTKISPSQAMSAVSAHEQEHVNNAYNKAEKDGGKVLQASVSIKTAICPECGKSYIAGGTTHTRIAYGNESNPYTKNQKSANFDALAGANFDATA